MTHWKKQLLDRAAEVFSSGKTDAAQADEALKAELYQQIGKLQVEVDWLKKSPDFRVNGATGMDRTGSRRSQHRRAMRAYGNLAVGPLLHAGSEKRTKPEANAFAGRAIHAHALLWGASNDVLAERTRLCGEPETRATAAAADGTGSDLSKATVVTVGGRTPHLPLSAAGSEDRAAEPGLGERYHVYTFAPRIYLPGGDPRLVQPIRSGWEVSASLESVFCVAALEWALQRGCPEIFNTDQGAQFSSEDFTQRLAASGITISMDGRGRAMDNIFVERLWRTVKYEEVYLHDYEQVEDAVKNLGDYFWFYNHERPHQALGYRTPAALYFGTVKGARA